MFMFKTQFKMSKREENALRRIIIYTIRFHIKAWFTSGNAIAAPNHDLNFMKDIYKYQTIDPEISKLAVKKFCNHLWYLSDETIALALFDQCVSLNEKRKMTKQLVSYMMVSEEDSPSVKRYHLIQSQTAQFCEMNLNDFITTNTSSFFQRFNISTSFLSVDPCQ